jgi:hypothetical protein
MEDGRMAMDGELRGWARRIERPADIPNEFAEAFRAAGIPTEPFPVVVHAPELRADQLSTPSTLVAQTDGAVFWFEKTGDGVQQLRMGLDQVAVLQERTGLLDSWIRWMGEVDRRPVSFQVRFNRASLPVLQPFFGPFQPAPAPSADAEGGASVAAGFETLGRFNYKYMAYAEESVPPGARVLGWVYENGMLDLKNRRVIRPTLLIRAERQVVLVRGEKEPLFGRAGAVRSYLPIEKIGYRHLLRQQDGWWRLELGLGAAGILTAHFSESVERELEPLLEGIAEISPSEQRRWAGAKTSDTWPGWTPVPTLIDHQDG